MEHGAIRVCSFATTERVEIYLANLFSQQEKLEVNVQEEATTLEVYAGQKDENMKMSNWTRTTKNWKRVTKN